MDTWKWKEDKSSVNQFCILKNSPISPESDSTLFNMFYQMYISLFFLEIDS